MLDVKRIREDFPLLQRQLHGKPLIWLDNAATTQKPQSVLDRIARYYQLENSNIHSGTHTLALETAAAYEGVRAKIATFLNAAAPEEVVFVRGATEGLNLLAATLGETLLEPGDEILLTESEHHSNIVPWQFAAKRSGAAIRVAPVDDNGDLRLEAYARLLGPRTKIVSFTHVSNVTGAVMPASEMTALARRHGTMVVIDGAQGIPHRRVDVRALDCDFYVFSGHKFYAPTGIGAVYGRLEHWERLPPWQGGGGMIRRVTFEECSFAAPPRRFEAGTPSLAPALGMGAALDYVNGLDMAAIESCEAQLLDYALEKMRAVPGLRLVGEPKDRAGVISLKLDGVPDEVAGKQLDAAGIAVRAGMHCAQPLLRRFGLESSLRASLSFYNTRDEADTLVEALKGISVRR